MMLPSGGVRHRHPIHLTHDTDQLGTAEKLLQAVEALNHAAALDPEHPELHIRLVDLKLRGALSCK